MTHLNVKSLFLFVLYASLSTTVGSAATTTFNVQERASTAQWAPAYSVAATDNELTVGAVPAAFGVGLGNQSSMARFDISSFAGDYISINSATLRLYIKAQHTGRVPATVEAHRLTAANADFTANGGWATKDGTNAWAGGANGGLVAGTDYVNSILGSVVADPTSAVGTAYDIVIPGAVAQALIDDWTTGTNEGFLLRANEPFPSEDNRTSFTLAPELIIDYVPISIPEPSTFVLFGAGLAGLAILRRGRRMTRN